MSVNKCISAMLGIRSTVSSRDGGLLLTFDDGPHPNSTPAILDTLDQYGAKAIFFIVAGRISKAPSLLSEIVSRGHRLGNHSYTHWLENPPRYPEYVADLEKCQREIDNNCGVQPRVFRPPLGQLTIGSLLAARKLQLSYVRWSLDSRDWELRDDNTAAQRGVDVARKAKAGDIVLMHDDNAHTPVLLKTMLAELSDKGFNLQPELPF